MVLPLTNSETLSTAAASQCDLDAGGAITPIADSAGLASHLRVVVYTAESPLRHPVLMMQEMGRDLLASRELAWRLFVRDTSAQYRQSLLGILWAFIPPLVAAFPFVFLDSQGIIAIQGTSIPYPAFAMIGTIIWQAFVDALNCPLSSMAAARSMLTRINFPREAILLSGLMQVVFRLKIRLVLLAGVCVWFQIAPPSTILLFPFGLMALILVGFAIGIVLTPIGLLYSDIQHAIPLGTMFLMYLTPVLYPQPKAGVAGILAHWNPLTPLVTSTRDWLTIGGVNQLGAFAAVTAVAVLLLFGGWAMYRLSMPHIIARIGN